MLVISDNSALSALAEIRLVPQLHALFGEIVITESVQREGSREEAPTALRILYLNPPPWLRIRPDPVSLLEETRGLGAGEASSISLA